jgi:hypothetical protein
MHDAIPISLPRDTRVARTVTQWMSILLMFKPYTVIVNGKF